MKKIFKLLSIVFIVCILSSCATIMSGKNQHIQIDSNPQEASVKIYDRSNDRLVFEGKTPCVVRFNRSDLKKGGSYRVITEKDRYETNTSVLTVGGLRFNKWSFLNFGPMIPLTMGTGYFDEVITIGGASATASFVAIDLAGIKPNINQSRLYVRLQSKQARVTSEDFDYSAIEPALKYAVDELLDTMPRRARIAVIEIRSRDRSIRNYVFDELEHILREDGYTIVDRRQLDTIREEQMLGASGEVSDDTAVSIGRLSGATVAITGSADGDGDLRRLRLRAINVETGEVIGTASQRF